MDGFAMSVLCDPQTSGGLLLFVGPEDADAAVAILKSEGLEHACIGRMENYDADQPRLRIVS
jgi:selenophosphate synthase